MNNKISRYSDIIDLPHHQSGRRPHMSVYNRAAQFAPFAALVGYDEMVQDTANTLLLDQRINLSEDTNNTLNLRMKEILENIKKNPKIRVTYYDELKNKSGGEYIVYSGKIKRIEEYPKVIVFEDGKRIYLDDIIYLDVESGAGMK